MQFAAGLAALPVTLGVAWAQTYPIAADPTGGSVSSGWCIRHAWPPLGGKAQTPARHDCDREHRGRGQLAGGFAPWPTPSPDGYTLFLGGTLPHVNEALLKSRPLYDPLKDLEPIVNVAANSSRSSSILRCRSQTLKELIAYAKANPGKLSYGHAGIGTTQHLAGELFKSLTDTPEIMPIPYRGTGPVIADVVAGQIPLGIPGLTGQVMEFHRSAKLRVLAVTSPTRLSTAPDLPTAAEQGLSGMTAIGSIGLLAPAGTPRLIADRIAQATRTVLTEQAFRQMLIEAAMEPVPDQTPEKFRQLLADDVAKWAPVVKALGLKID